MPEIDGVEYDEEGYQFMLDLAAAEPRPPTAANEARVTHTIYEEFPGTRMLTAYEAAAMGSDKLSLGSGAACTCGHPESDHAFTRGRRCLHAFADPKRGPCECGGYNPSTATLDSAESQAAREDGMAKVERGTDEDWKGRAASAVLAVCRERELFTADNIWEKVEKPREPRALGPIMTAAVRRGWCEPTGQVKQSQIPVHHQAPVREYRSLVYDGIPY